MSNRDLDEFSAYGVYDAMRIQDTTFVHPSITVNGSLYIGTYMGEQKLLHVATRLMDNSDGSAWRYGGQKKTCLYYLITYVDESREQEFSWCHIADID